jgi:adenylosuccinate lyase
VIADSYIATDYILAKLEWVLDGLQVYPERMLENLEATRGLIYSSRVLLALVDAGLTREEAYAVVQRSAMAVWEDLRNARSGPSYRDLLLADEGCSLDGAALDAIFDPRAFLTRAGVVFERVKALEF